MSRRTGESEKGARRDRWTRSSRSRWQLKRISRLIPGLWLLITRLLSLQVAYKTLRPGLRQQHLPTSIPVDNIIAPRVSGDYQYKTHHQNRMSLFTVVAVLFVCLAIILGDQGAQAAVAKVHLTNPDHPGKCVLDSNTIMSPGQKGKQPNHPCAGVECHEGGMVTIRTCAAVAPPKGCKQRDFVNTNRNYPECCERAYDCTKHI